MLKASKVPHLSAPWAPVFSYRCMPLVLMSIVKFCFVFPNVLFGSSWSSQSQPLSENESDLPLSIVGFWSIFDPIRCKMLVRVSSKVSFLREDSDMNDQSEWFQTILGLVVKLGH